MESKSKRVTHLRFDSFLWSVYYCITCPQVLIASDILFSTGLPSKVAYFTRQIWGGSHCRSLIFIAMGPFIETAKPYGSSKMSILKIPEIWRKQFHLSGNWEINWTCFVPIGTQKYHWNIMVPFYPQYGKTYGNLLVPNKNGVWRVLDGFSNIIQATIQDHPISSHPPRFPTWPLTNQTASLSQSHLIQPLPEIRRSSGEIWNSINPVGHLPVPAKKTWTNPSPIGISGSPIPPIHQGTLPASSNAAAPAPSGLPPPPRPCCSAAPSRPLLRPPRTTEMSVKTDP